MTQNEAHAALLQTGPFMLDLERMRLTRDGALIALGGQPLLILAALLREPGRVVTRAELTDALWPHATRIDTTRRLNTAMRALREALGDGAETPLFIETVRGRGYRWIGEEREPPAPRARLGAAAAFACALVGAFVLGSGHAPTAAPVSAAQRAQFVEIAADTDVTSAAQALDALIAARPNYRAARVLRAEMAVRQWRAQPTQARYTDSKAMLNATRRAVGDSADLAVLDAELTLAGAWDWAGAERLYRRALTLDPHSISAREGLAWLLLNAGREGEAFAALEPVLTNADLTDATRADLGWFLLRLKRDDLALAMCAQTRSHHVNLLACRHSALARRGDFAAARDVALALMLAVDAAPEAIAAVRQGAPESGYQRFLQWRTRDFLREDGHWFQRAQFQADAGAYDAALASLQRAYAAREPAMVKLWSTQEFAALRTAPQFMALWQAVGPQA